MYTLEFLSFFYSCYLNTQITNPLVREGIGNTIRHNF